MNQRITALVWDFDDTIGDTAEKNLRVTKEIVDRVTGRNALEFPVLRTLESYRSAHRRLMNWRQFYIADLGLTEQQTDEAGKLWAEYQLQDGAPTPVFHGIDQVLASLHRFPHGIVSQNAKRIISSTLAAADLLKHFRCIIGYEEVDLRKPKPAPDGLMLCLKELTALAPGVVLYIGDHEVDMETALNANRHFNERGLDVQVVTIAAKYSSHDDTHEWKIRPDFTARDPAAIVEVVNHWHGL
jgi:HAD superfamily hydrolase (TIGR01549 family)